MSPRYNGQHAKPKARAYQDHVAEEPRDVDAERHVGDDLQHAERSAPKPRGIQPRAYRTFLMTSRFLLLSLSVLTIFSSCRTRCRQCERERLLWRQTGIERTHRPEFIHFALLLCRGRGRGAGRRGARWSRRHPRRATNSDSSYVFAFSSQPSSNRTLQILRSCEPGPTTEIQDKILALKTPYTHRNGARHYPVVCACRSGFSCVSALHGAGG